MRDILVLVLVLPFPFPSPLLLYGGSKHNTNDNEKILYSLSINGKSKQMRCICQIQFVSGEFYVARSFKVTHNILVRILSKRLMTGATEMLRKQLNLPELY